MQSHGWTHWSLRVVVVLAATLGVVRSVRAAPPVTSRDAVAPVKAPDEALHDEALPADESAQVLLTDQTQNPTERAAARQPDSPGQVVFSDTFQTKSAQTRAASQAPAPNPPAPPPAPAARPSPPAAAPAAAPARSAAQQALIARGNAAFQNACTQCHDAERSTSKTKDLAGWRATVRRMAGKNGANVPQGDWEAIATYLASLSTPAGGAAGSSAAAAEQSLAIWATFSPMWREGNGHRVELVEAAMRIDLGRWICERDTPIKAVVDAGRFIVPFGAFSAQVNPGVYRTVAKPLIFTMGQRVFPTDIGDPVLPMPYADQGSNFSLAVPLRDKGTATFDAYVVNGLRGNANGIDFYQSRNYVDGNKEPAAGTRVTLGNQFVRLGSSLTAGRFNDDTGSGPRNQALYYRIYGFDLQAHYENLWRVQFEYADRDTDRIVNLPGLLSAREHISGLYLEGEARLRKTSKFSVLGRYDTLYHRAALPPPGSVLTTGRFDVMRTTLGLNYQLAGNSLLMINWEHWHLPGNLPNQEVYGVRWAATF